MLFKRFFTFVLALMLACSCIHALADSYNMPYYIGVDVTNQIVTIYRTEDDAIVRQMLTSSGMNDCTPNGTFHLTPKGRLSERGEWTWFDQYQCWVKYATRIYKGYMFHSLPFAEKDESTMLEDAAREFGMPTSHGCMRLRVDDARFIAKECLEGTMVKIYKNEEKLEELRRLLLISSYTGEDGMSYSEFLGYSEDALGRGASGTQVEDLQCRLMDLGYYAGPLDGKYDTDIIAAVKLVQRDLGLAQSGITSPELQQVLFSEEAPVSAGLTTLQEGRSGPVVKKLQSALKAIGLYAGEMDSVYDLDVAEAVRAFQSACGYTIDGIATAEIQHALYYQMEQLKETFGENIPAPELVTEEITMGRLDSENNIIVRAKPTTEAQNLGKLRDGDVMMVNESKDGWSSITVGGGNGFIMSKYIDTYVENNVILKYSANGASYQIGRTMEEYRGGAPKVAEEFSAYYTSEQFVSSADMVDYVTVNTGSDEVRLNLRSIPAAEGEILAEVPNGTNLRVLGTESGYTKVGFDEQIGFLLSDYLTAWKGSADDVESTELPDESYVDTLDTEDGAINAIVILAGEKDAVKVYELGSEESVILGELPEGTQVEVVNLTEVEDWVRIRYEDKEGYMREANLQFQLM